MFRVNFYAVPAEVYQKECNFKYYLYQIRSNSTEL